MDNQLLNILNSELYVLNEELLNVFDLYKKNDVIVNIRIGYHLSYNLQPENTVLKSIVLITVT